MVGLAKTLVVTGALGTAAMTVPHAAGDQPITLRFTAHTTHERLVDRGRSGLSVGDVRMSGGRLVGADGRRLGSFGATCVVVDVGRAAALQCDGYAALPAGQVAYVGEVVPGKRVQVAAITGGTGDYVDARGQLSITRVKAKVARVTMSILE
ncbi:MAG TPA: hypothetical protein VLK36_16830 [Gaiellaceae bacterium]|nr:hypothetical protein [Gaiellaceae bacterium]